MNDNSAVVSGELLYTLCYVVKTEGTLTTLCNVSVENLHWVFSLGVFNTKVLIKSELFSLTVVNLLVAETTIIVTHRYVEKLWRAVCRLRKIHQRCFSKARFFCI